MMFNLLAEDIMPLELVISAVLLALIVLMLAILFDGNKGKFNTRCIAFAGIAVALSISLSFVKLFKLPQGGSITLVSVLPMLLFSFIYGTKKGVLVGLILGTLNFVVDPYIVHPAQVILDYFLSYCSLGLVGIFAKIKAIHKYPILEFVLGSIVACSLRFCSQVLSGIFAFSAYANFDVIFYSLAYNSYVFVDAGIAIAVGAIMLTSKPLTKYLLK